MLEKYECPRVYIVVDGLDECQDSQDEMDNFLKIIIQTGVTRPSNVKWLFTSRPLKTNRLLAWPNQVLVLDLEDANNRRFVAQGVAAYLTQRVLGLRHQNDYSPEFCEDINASLIPKADDSYMWASLVCNRIEVENVRQRDVLETIERFPPGLDSFYSESLSRLSSGNSGTAERGMRLLKAVMLAYRPPTVAELSAVLCLFEESITSIDALIKGHCCGFIRKQEHTETVEFIHHSAREFLEGEGLSIVDAYGSYGHSEMTMGCLSYLSQNLKVNLTDLPRPDSKWDSWDREKYGPLLATMDYAANFWAQHFLQALADGTILRQNAFGDQGVLCLFIRTKFLQWLECLSLLGTFSSSTSEIFALCNAVRTFCYEQSPLLRVTLEDTTSFYFRTLVVFYQSYIKGDPALAPWDLRPIGQWPLQLYNYAITSTPRTNAVIRECFDEYIPQWLREFPQQEEVEESLIWTFEDQNTPDKCSDFTFSPNDENIVTISDSTIELWSLETGERWKTINCDPGLLADGNTLSCVAVSPNGKQIATGHRNTVVLWDVATGGGKKIWELQNCFGPAWVKDQTTERVTGPVQAITYSPDGGSIAFGLPDKIVVWGMATDKSSLGAEPIQVNPVDERGNLSAMKFSPDGSWIAETSRGYYIKLWDVVTRKLRARLWGSSTEISDILFLPGRSCERIAAVSKVSIQLWNFRAFYFLKEIKINADPELWGGILRFSSNGNQILSSSKDGAIKLWDILVPGFRLSDTDNLSMMIVWNCLTFSPDGNFVASSFDNVIKLWNAATGRLLKVITPRWHRNSYVLKFTLDSKRIAFGSASENEKHTILVWDVVGDSHNEYQMQGSVITAIEFSPDGQLVALGTDSGSIRLLDARTSEARLTIDYNGHALKSHLGGISCLAFSSDGRRILSGSYDCTAMLWSTKTGDYKATFLNVHAIGNSGTREGRPTPSMSLREEHLENLHSVAFCQDRGLIAGSGYRGVNLWRYTEPQGLTGIIATRVSQALRPFHAIRWPEMVLRVRFANSLKFISSGDNRYLATNRGRAKVDDVFRLLGESSYEPEFETMVEGLGVRDGWIYYGGIGVFALPVHPIVTTCDIRGDRVAIGLEDGQVLVFKFDRELLRSMLES
ncbi:hypothetical protein TWF481_008278 [Arthrobotrys musiformis]|uniref:Nephrocystin 3-like N-terminal domain-containing protein n=1 Tax=Arthrobotrys musiformis TaxID=47236 RepID=A0AAV9W8I6_9PEZI